MIPILLDPWFIEFSSNDSYVDMNAKMGPLRIFLDLLSRYPLNVVPFISEAEKEKFWQEHRNKFVADRRIVAMFINSLTITDQPLVMPATITAKPCPKLLPQSWLKVLATNGNTDKPPKWRHPMLFAPRARRSDWPATEIKYTHNGSSDQKTRNLVIIEEHQEHKYFIRDIDPWRLRCIGEPMPGGTLSERKETCRRLPRPPLLNIKLPLSQLAEVTRCINDCTCGTNTHYYYLPSSSSWQPTDRKKDDWRRNAFERDGVVLKK